MAELSLKCKAINFCLNFPLMAKIQTRGEIMNIWKDDEVKDLFKMVEESKLKKSPLREAFLNHAQKYQRKANSVRNYYYHEVDNLEKDMVRAGRLGIDVKNHLKNKLVPFTKEQEEDFMREIKALTDKGVSVRAACFKLSGGDMTKMTRLQNKYQNLKSQKVVPNNIVKFKQRTLTDSDINSLFLGLVKLIKRSASDAAMEKVSAEKEKMGALLREAYHELSKKDKEIFAIKEDLKRLKLENERLSLNVKKFLMSKSEKLKKLVRNADAT